MKTKTIFILGVILIILLLAFITNPDKEKHINNAIEVVINKDNENDFGILGGLVDTFFKPTLAPKVKVDNYYLFSISYLSSNDKKQRIDLGLGLFGQVLPLSTKDEIEAYNAKSNKKIDRESIIGTYQFNKDNSLNVIAINLYKLKFSLDLYNGRNLGSIDGVATLIGNVATFENNELGHCKFSITFETDKAIIETFDNGDECGFGNGVMVDKVYRKIN